MATCQDGWRSKEIKAYSSKIFEQSRSSSDERQGHSTIFASALVCFCIEAGTSSPLTRFVRAWCILVYSRPASLPGNYRVCKCYCKRLKFTGDANVRYFSIGDLLAERSTFGASLISKLACIPHVQELWACSVSQEESDKKGRSGSEKRYVVN
jgi:hypothetical protein